MNIKGINSQGVNNIYKSNAGKMVNKVGKVDQKDSIEISTVGKNLSSYAADYKVNDDKKIEELKMKIQNGTYNVEAKHTAQKIIDMIKGKSV